MVNGQALLGKAKQIGADRELRRRLEMHLKREWISRPRFLCRKSAVTKTFSLQTMVLSMLSGSRRWWLWTVRALEMRHCIGHGGYDHLLARDGHMFLSLRDQFGRPHRTLEVIADKIVQFHGKGNSIPKAEYRAAAESLLHPLGIEFTAVGTLFGILGEGIPVEDDTPPWDIAECYPLLTRHFWGNMSGRADGR